MKASAYIAQFIAEQGIKTVFAVGGGASLHMIHSIAERGDTKLVYPHHEQAAGFAADGYARATGSLGCAIVTSGPGATNLITAIAGAWFDSIPVLFLTGQTKSSNYKAHFGVRQTGFQETDIVSMVRGVTKYAETVTNVDDLPSILANAVASALSGRRGPVVVDICDDVQRADLSIPVTIKLRKPYVVMGERDPIGDFARELSIASAAKAIRHAARPLMVLGAGAVNARDEAMACAQRWDIPIAPTWAALDMYPSGHPKVLGPWGTHGLPWVNRAVMECDLLLCVGTRLDTHMTGSDVKSLAPKATKIVVDIDPTEVNARHANIHILSDAKAFFDELDVSEQWRSSEDSGNPATCYWHRQIARWKAEDKRAKVKGDALDPYTLMEDISARLPDDAQIYVDTGTALAIACQALQLREGQRLISDWNNTSMGWALPAAIGGAAATGKPTVCIVGDGALMFNIQELQTLATSGLPVMVIVVENGGYAMCRQTQDQWFGGNYESSQASGFPDFNKVARSFGVQTVEATLFKTMPNHPTLLVTHVDRAVKVHGQVRHGRPIAELESVQ